MSNPLSNSMAYRNSLKKKLEVAEAAISTCRKKLLAELAEWASKVKDAHEKCPLEKQEKVVRLILTAHCSKWQEKIHDKQEHKGYISYYSPCPYPSYRTHMVKISTGQLCTINHESKDISVQDETIFDRMANWTDNVYVETFNDYYQPDVDARFDEFSEYLVALYDWLDKEMNASTE